MYTRSSQGKLAGAGVRLEKRLVLCAVRKRSAGLSAGNACRRRTGEERVLLVEGDDSSTGLRAIEDFSSHEGC